jgi:hypothetical protein
MTQRDLVAESIALVGDVGTLPWSEGRWAVADALLQRREHAIAKEEYSAASELAAMARVVARCDPEYYRAMARVALAGL